MLQLVLLTVGFLVLMAAMYLVPWIIMAGIGADEVRNRLLCEWYRTFTYEGDVIPGVRPSRMTRLLIRAFSHEDDQRQELVVRAMRPERIDVDLGAAHGHAVSVSVGETP
jgi:hypothetical protein